MSLPPLVIKIKRKATDEPVDLLRVHEENTGKRRKRALDYVFQRQPEKTPTEGQSLDATTDSGQRAKRFQTEQRQSETPTVRITKPGDELQDPYLQALGHVPRVPRSKVVASTKSIEPRPIRTLSPRPISKKSSTNSLKKHAIRRFHMSRSSLSADQKQAGSKKSNHEVALFMERGSTTKLVDTASSRDEVVEPKQTEILQAQAPPVVQAEHPMTTLDKSTVVEDAKTNNGNAFPQTWGQDPEELARAMQEFTLQEIAKNLAATSLTEPKTAATPPRPGGRKLPSRFKPKLPAERRRAPVELQSEVKVTDLASQLLLDEAAVDEDYVYETYIRVPASNVILDESNYGIIVLEDNDLEHFYGNDDSDENDEMYDEEEDENAESHPFNDYPDEELASDDELGVNPYQFRNYRSSEEDDFAADNFEDSSDGNATDDEAPDITPNIKPTWLRPAGAYGRRSDQATYNEFRSYCEPDDL